MIERLFKNLLMVICCIGCGQSPTIYDEVTHQYSTDAIKFKGKVIFPEGNELPGCGVLKKMGLKEAVVDGNNLYIFVIDPYISTTFVVDFLNIIHASLDSLKVVGYQVIIEEEPVMIEVNGFDTRIFYEIYQGDILGGQVFLGNQSPFLSNYFGSNLQFWLDKANINWHVKDGDYKSVKIMNYSLFSSARYDEMDISCFDNRATIHSDWFYTVNLKLGNNGFEVEIN